MVDETRLTDPVAARPLQLPDPSLVVLVGASGAGKSTFAGRHFRPTEILSSDYFRALITDDENDQSASGHAFYLLKYVAERRSRWRRMTVIDATNVEHGARRTWVALAQRHELPAIAIVFDLPEDVLRERSTEHRTPGVAESHHEELRRSVHALYDEGFARVITFTTAEEVESVELDRIAGRS